MSFNQREYINKYKKEHYSKLSVDLLKEDKEKLVMVCNEQGITIKQFILDALNKSYLNMLEFKSNRKRKSK